MGIEDGGPLSRTGVLTAERLTMTLGSSSTVAKVVTGITPKDYLKSVQFVQFTAGVPSATTDQTEFYEIVIDDEISDTRGGGGPDTTDQLCVVEWYDSSFDEGPPRLPGNN